MSRETNTAVFPGAFDPVTYGHLDIIKRGARLFDRLVVGVGDNPEKTALFTGSERVEMLKSLVDQSAGIEVVAYQGLTMEFVKSCNAKAILRGIRDGTDLRNELQAANTNLLVGDVETVFLMTTDQHALISSTLIKQIIEIGGRDQHKLSRLVPDLVLNKLISKIEAC